MRRTILIIWLLLFSFCFNWSGPINSALAQEDSPFETSLETIYDVSDSGSTTVTHSFAVRNLQPTIFLQEYSLTTNFPNLEAVSASSNNTEITPTVSNENNKTTIAITFPDEVVGQNKIRNFSISYTIPQMAIVAGQVLEIQLPPLSSSDKYQTHTVILKTPLRFGRATRVTPEPISVAVENQQIITTFDHSKPQPISAFFGEQQIYSMTLRYNLENNSSSAGLAQIALPPDTSFQRVHYHSLDPGTNDIKIDEDGNWLATYQLAPNTAQTVYLTADILVTLAPNETIPVIQPANFHTAEKKYWEKPHSLDVAMSKWHTAEDLYSHVVSTLEYSYEKVNNNQINNRLGAKEALERPTEAVCQEYTDLFIAMARAKDIPARRLTGYAYTQNPELRPLSLESDVLHAWPEFYNQDKGYWQPVDPTWEDTTGGIDYFNSFDLNHVVFAINGKSSTTPYPAGAYKGADLSTKDVEVTFADSFPTIEPDIDVVFEPVQEFGITMPGKYLVRVTNPTPQAWYDVVVELETTTNQSWLDQNSLTIPTLIPYQSVEFPVQLLSNGWTQENSDVSYNFSVLKREKVNGETINVTSGPSFIRYFTKQNIIIGLGIGSILCVLAAWSLLVLRRIRQRTVRR